MGATALFMAPGCDQVEDLDDGGFDDWTFRCTVIGGCPDDGYSGGGGGGTGPKGNTSFLGEIVGAGDVFDLNELSRTGGTVGGVTITGITAQHCISGELEFVGTSEANPAIPLSADGTLLPKVFTRLDDPTKTCTVTSDNWFDTYWSISYDLYGVQFDTSLWIEAISVDADGTRRYKLKVDSDNVPDGRGGWLPTCDYEEEPENNSEGFDAYFIPGLTLVEDGQEQFGSNPDTFFLACISGSIGKALYWDYKPFVPEIGPAGHEVAHNAIRAEYCGHGMSYTQTGTPVWFQSVFTDEGPDPSSPDPNSTEGSAWKLEAVWSTDPLAPALCVGRTRLAENQPAAGQGFLCPLGPGPDPEQYALPICDPAVHFADPTAVLASWSHFPDPPAP